MIAGAFLDAPRETWPLQDVKGRSQREGKVDPCGTSVLAESGCKQVLPRRVVDVLATDETAYELMTEPIRDALLRLQKQDDFTKSRGYNRLRRRSAGAVDPWQVSADGLLTYRGSAYVTP